MSLRNVAVILSATPDGGPEWTQGQGALPFGLNYWGTPDQVRARVVTLGQWITAISYGLETFGAIDLYGQKNAAGIVVDYYPVPTVQGLSYTSVDAQARAAADGYVASHYGITIVLRPVVQDFSSASGGVVWLDNWLHVWLLTLRLYGIGDATLGNPFVPTGLAVYHPTTHPNVDQKVTVHWLSTSQQQPVGLTEQGAYVLTPIETATGLKQLRVQQTDGTLRTIEYRVPDQWDYAHGAGFVFGQPGMGNGLVDTTPSTTTNPWDAILHAGETFYDPALRMLYVSGLTGQMIITRNANPPIPSVTCQQGQTVTAADGAIWTIGPHAPPPYDVGNIFRNGLQVSGQGKQLLVRGPDLYVEGFEQRWYKYTSLGWINVVTPQMCTNAPTPPPLTNAEKCAQVPNGQLPTVMVKGTTTFTFTFTNGGVVIGTPAP